MGIKNLWTVLEPYSERKPLSELQGKVVCVDLAGWVCESMNITDFRIEPKMYIKQLFFRTSYLLLANVTPIFLTEGETPELKFQVIAKRNEMQFMGARPRAATQTQSQGAKNPKGRTRFNYILKQCQELIGCLGMQSIEPPGEAEAYGAHLNALGLVDGVISQDSDCFAYGARRVYRNFSVAQASGGMVDVYDMDRINRMGSLDLGQDKIIVMGLLCGCDYCPEGVDGVGKDGVVKLWARYKNNEIIDALHAWRFQLSKFEAMERRVADTTICNTCGHLGKQASHTRKGCGMCGTNEGCKVGPWKEERLAMKQELQIRSKALLQKDFPSTKIIHEFKKVLPRPKELNFSWRQPNIVKFVNVMGRHLEWSEIYAFQKVFPLLTRWQLYQENHAEVNKSQRGFVVPSFIKKKRVIKCVPSYEIIWRDEHNYFRDLLPDEQLNNFLLEHENDADVLWTTIEPAVLVDRVYPHLIEEFEVDKLAKKKQKTTKTKRAAKSPGVVKKKRTKEKISDSLTNFDEMQAELDAIPTKAAKKRIAKKPAVQQIEKFFPVHQPVKTQLNESLMALPLDLEEDCENIGDLSNLIADIVSRSPAVKSLNGHELKFFADFAERRKGDSQVEEEEKEEEVPNQSYDDIDLLIMRKKAAKPRHKRVTELLSSTPISKAEKSSAAEEQSSSFFTPATEEQDLFELSYNELITGTAEED